MNRDLHNRTARRRLTIAAICLFLAMRPALSEPRVETSSHAGITATLSADPGNVRLDRTVLVTLRIDAPSEIEVTVPDIRDRLQGFVLSGSYDENPPPRDGKMVLMRHMRLTPVLTEHHRIGAMAIRYTDKGKNPAVHGWFPTRAITFEVEPAAVDTPSDDIASVPTIRRVLPSPRQILAWTGILLALAALATGIVFVARRIRLQVKLMRMSPRERALYELEQLLARDLVAKERVKDFYVELTMIVRRYIERQHAIRAPEQTTREFLDAVSKDSRFPGEVVTRLKSFLEAADLVKFAAHRPTPDAVDNAVATAKTYITSEIPSPKP